MRLRRASWLGVAGASVVLMGQLLAGSADAQLAGESAAGPSFYSAAAQADGMRLGMAVPEGVAVVTNQVIDGSGPHAQAVLDSLGASTSRAAMPYPGEAAITGPGTAAGAANLPFSPPNYPFYVAASSPAVPESKLDGGGFTLTAAAQPASAGASAKAGSAEPAIGHFAAVAHVELGDSGIVAEAVSRSEMVSVGELTIGSVLSQAKVSQAVGAPRARATEFRAAGLSIAGRSFGVTAEGLVYPDGKTPLPGNDPVRQLLEQAKTSVRFVAAEETPEGVISAGISVTSVQPIPGTGKDGTITLTLGRAFAAAQVAGGDEPATEETSEAGIPVDGPAQEGNGGQRTGVSDKVDTVTTETGPAVSSAQSSFTRYDASFPGGAAAAYGSGNGGLPEHIPGLSSDVPAASSVAEAAAAPPPAQTIQVASAQNPSAAGYVEGPYAVAVLAGIGALAGAMFLRRVGVKA